jgi:hypothetical protein
MKSIKFLLVLLLSAGFVTGCFDEADKTYQGPNLVEFSPVKPSSNAYAQTVTVPASGSVTIPVSVQLVGPHQTSDTDVTFTVSGTASSGSMFTIAGTSTKIPAGTSFGTINVVANSAGFASLAAGTTRTVVIELTGGTFAANPNYKTFTLTLRK